MPNLILLELQFKTLLPIGNLPHFHGVQWSTLFRELLTQRLPEGLSMSSAGISIQSIETGINHYDPNQPIQLGISFPDNNRHILSRLLADFNTLMPAEGHFMPGRNILLECVRCRISGHSEPELWHSLTEAVIANEVWRLMELEDFTIHLTSPLRLPRPEGHKMAGHRYYDTEYFEDHSIADPFSPLAHFINRVRVPNLTKNINTDMPLRVTSSVLNWVDVTYGVREHKTIGGIMGKIKVSGKPSQEVARLLVIGQYVGVGKNAVFGFGYFTIPELQTISNVRPLSRGKSILEQHLTKEGLRRSLYALPNSSPGEDNITIEDLKKAGDTLLERLCRDFLEGAFVYGRLKTYKTTKADGSTRNLFIQNAIDRLMHRVLADAIAPVIEGLISNSAYAYRRGLNIKGAAKALNNALQEGYTNGFKADISSFFDSVNLDTLEAILEGILPFEPLTEKIMVALRHMQAQGTKGLPQGSPLSPILSNLYLDRFDRAIQTEGLRLIRYSDDFVVLSKGDYDTEEALNLVKLSLKRLHLTLKDEKTVFIEKGSGIRFLGHLVSADAIQEIETKVDNDINNEWIPAFREEIQSGVPVYLSSICRGAFSRGADLVINLPDNESEQIPWKRLSRIVIVGRASFSGGVIYRAIKEALPVTFIDIMGKAHGHLYPEDYHLQDMTELQRKYAKDRDFCLNFAKEIISAKIHNSSALLKRNGVVIEGLEEYLDKIKGAPDIDNLRGYEGASAKLYWQAFAGLVEPFEFKGRVYHPPDNIVNVMLSLGYTLLYNRITSAILEAGLNPRIGFFHQGRGSHSALASDLLEQVRHICERIVLALIHRKEIKVEDTDMVQRGEKEVPRLKGEGFRKFVHRYEVTMATKASYFGGQKLSYNAWIDETVADLKRAMKLNIPYKALRIR